MAQEGHRRSKQMALTRLQLQAIRAQSLKYQRQIRQRSTKSPAERNDIIKVDQAAIPPETLEYSIHQSLEGRRSIAQAKRHNSELEQPGVCRKCRLSSGRLRQRDLPVAAGQNPGSKTTAFPPAYPRCHRSAEGGRHP